MNKMSEKYWAACPQVKRLGGVLRRIDRDARSPIDMLLVEVNRFCLDMIRQHSCAPLVPPYPTFIIESTDCNAAAITNNGNFAVFITTELIVKLSSCLRIFICNSQIMRENFGRDSRTDAALVDRDASYFLKSSGADEVRYFFNSLGRALEFVCFHEIAHRIRNHSQHFPTVDHTRFFEEILWMSKSAPGIDVPIRQQCEIDADMFALQLCHDGDLMSHSAGTEGEERHDFWLSEMTIRLVGLVNLFLVLDTNSHDRRVVYDALYPPLLHRAILLSRAVQKAHTRLGGIDPAFAIGIESQIWIDIAECASFLGIPAGLWTGPQPSVVRIEELNQRLVGFRRFQDALDVDLSSRLNGSEHYHVQPREVED